MKQTSDTSQAGRRAFLQRLLAGSAAGALLVYKQPGLASLMAGNDEPAENTAPTPDYAFVVEPRKCIGCGRCVQACAYENDVPEGQYRTWIERYVVTEDGEVHVDSPNGGMDGFEEVDASVAARARKSFFVPKLCNHCKEAPCVQVCPVGATFRTAEGFVLVDPDHCIGCSYCVQACPYGVRFINSRTRTADKCTWCHHRVIKGALPACVTVCPTQARLFGNLNDPDSTVARIFRDEDWDTLKPSMHTHSMCLYLKLPREVV